MNLARQNLQSCYAQNIVGPLLIESEKTTKTQNLNINKWTTQAQKLNHHHWPMILGQGQVITDIGYVSIYKKNLKLKLLLITIINVGFFFVQIVS